MTRLFALLLLILIQTAAFADRTIVTPSGYTTPDGYDASFFQTVNGQARSIGLADASAAGIQLQATYASRPDVDRLSLGAEAELFPETFTTPSVSFGISDITNSDSAFSVAGFYGRSYYIAVSKSLDADLNPPPIHGVILTGGLGVGGYHGPFGGVTMNLPFHLIGTAEYDTRCANYRISVPFAPIAQISFDRIGSSNCISIDIHSVVSL